MYESVVKEAMQDNGDALTLLELLDVADELRHSWREGAGRATCHKAQTLAALALRLAVLTREEWRNG